MTSTMRQTIRDYEYDEVLDECFWFDEDMAVSMPAKVAERLPRILTNILWYTRTRQLPQDLGIHMDGYGLPIELKVPAIYPPASVRHTEVADAEERNVIHAEWIRLAEFLAAPRIIVDTYGLPHGRIMAALDANARVNNRVLSQQRTALSV